MVTSLNQTSPARDRGEQLTHFLRRRINVGQSGGLITTVAFPVGVLPANAAIVGGGGVWVSTDLGGTTNTLDIGYAADSLSSADADAYATALALPLTTGGFVPLDEIVAATGRTAIPRSVDTTVTATFTGTATTGVVDICIPFMPLNPPS
jgi:hypothetical protein